MEQETYKTLEYKDKISQKLRGDMMDLFFKPMEYEPTTGDWVAIKNFTEDALNDDKKLSEEMQIVWDELLQADKDKNEDLLDNLYKKYNLLSLQNATSLVEETFARFFQWRTNRHFYGYKYYLLDPTLLQREGLTRIGVRESQLLTEEQYLLRLGSVLNDA